VCMCCESNDTQKSAMIRDGTFLFFINYVSARHHGKVVSEGRDSKYQKNREREKKS